MSFFNSLNIAGSGLTASRARLDVISENIANATTTRTESGGPYRRKMVVYESVNGNSFKDVLAGKTAAKSETSGVRVAEIVEDQSDFTPVYNPQHPDADENGYVLMPNVDTAQETLDFMTTSRAYELNLNAIDALKDMANKALQIGK